jgi:hypothetical protein
VGELRALTLSANDAATPRIWKSFLPAPSAAGERAPGLMDFLVVQGKDLAVRDALAARALAALCGAWPRLQAADEGAWSAARPGAPLPVGWPYVGAVARRPASAADACNGGALRPDAARRAVGVPAHPAPRPHAVHKGGSK